MNQQPLVLVVDDHATNVRVLSRGRGAQANAPAARQRVSSRRDKRRASCSTRSAGDG